MPCYQVGTCSGCGSPPCGTTGDVVPTVTRCAGSVVVPGATVSVTLNGAPWASGTTGAAGTVTFPRTAADVGAFVATATYPNYSTATASITLADCSTGWHPTLDVEAQGDYVRSGGCPAPWPATINLTDPTGVVTPLTYDADTATWWGARSISNSGGIAACSSPYGGPSIVGAIRFQASITCDGKNNFLVRVSYSVCSGGGISWSDSRYGSGGPYMLAASVPVGSPTYDFPSGSAAGWSGGEPFDSYSPISCDTPLNISLSSSPIGQANASNLSYIFFGDSFVSGPVTGTLTG